MKKIVIIDDDPEIIDVLTAFFGQLNYEVTPASTKERGLRAFVIVEPDLTLIDVHLPDGSGLDLLDEIIELNNKAKVIMISGFKDADKVIEAYRHGALDFMLKPFDFEYVKRIVGEILD